MPSLRTTTVWGLRGAATVLFVWIPVLAVSLKTAGVPRVETMAWVSLDLLELTGLVATLDCVRRGSNSVRVVGWVTAGLFVLDAMVDTATSSASPSALTTATVMALLAELPVAFGCAVLAGGLGGLRLGQGWRVPTPARTAE